MGRSSSFEVDEAEPESEVVSAEKLEQLKVEASCFQSNRESFCDELYGLEILHASRMEVRLG
jgi:hypothetical protein